MRLSEITDTTSDAVRSAGNYLNDVTTPSIRLGVTGLSRAGKTVFITGLVHALINGRARPPLMTSRLPGFRAFLEPQPDDDLPRFSYETHLSALIGDTPHWPESTRHISQLRVTMEWDAQDWARRTAGIGRRLHLDIVDYPGEWLLDLSLMEQDYATWAKAMNAYLDGRPRDGRLEAWLNFRDGCRSSSPLDEQVAIEGARLFAASLASVRDNDRFARLLTPGRFLLPGDLEGSPLLTFFPLNMTDSDGIPKAGTLGGLLARRYESYKAQVVRPFFERHFMSLDRQIVLVDALSAFNGGAYAVIELERALESALRAFRPGRQSWLASLFGRRIDRVLFAATKADHLHRANHDRLAGMLRAMTDRAAKRATGAGSDAYVTALASIKATTDVEYVVGGSTMPCIRGRPLPGETVGDRRFDGTKDAAVFPGDLPADPLEIFDEEAMRTGRIECGAFQPTRSA